MQFNQQAAYCRLPGQCLGKGLGGGLVLPDNFFYNQRVVLNSHQFNHQLVGQIQTWARELGFSQVGIAGVDLSSAEPGLSAWLAAGFHGDMHYMA
ncbi:MAG: hypothetical protein ACREO9_09940, partial [Lysobacterales bacterium]